MKKLSVILCIVWMGFIFYNSSQSGITSNYRSNILLSKIKEYKDIMRNTTKNSINNKSKVNEIDENEILDLPNRDSNKLNNNVLDNNKNLNNSKILESNKILSINKQTIKKYLTNIKNNIKKLIVKYFKNFNIFIRKSAHAFEFFVLAILLLIAMFTRNIKGKKAFIYTLAVVLIYAITDEIHQIFVPGRTAAIKDVLIDFSGGVIGVTILCLLCKLGESFRLKNYSKR